MASVVDGEINRAASFGRFLNARMYKYQPYAEMRNVMFVKPEKLDKVDLRKCSEVCSVSCNSKACDIHLCVTKDRFLQYAVVGS